MVCLFVFYKIEVEDFVRISEACTKELFYARHSVISCVAILHLWGTTNSEMKAFWVTGAVASMTMVMVVLVQVMVSPIETAIETMEDKNKKLAMEIEQYRHNPQLGINPLSMSLNGVVDPAVQGGIAMYKVFFSCWLPFAVLGSVSLTVISVALTLVTNQLKGTANQVKSLLDVHFPP